MTTEQIKENIKKAEYMISSPDIEESHKEKFRTIVSQLKERLKESQETPAKKAEEKTEKTEIKKEPKAKKVAPEKKEKQKKAKKNTAKTPKPEKQSKPKGKVVVIDGEEYGQDSKDFCDKLLAKWNERKAAAKKAQKKHKTKSVFEVMAGKLDGLANTIIKNVAANPSEARPHIVIGRLEKVEEIFKRMFADLKSVLGDDYDKEEAKEFLAGLHQVITEFKAKLEAKKAKK
jgi:chemotaxis protein histidine kinase CheA